MGVPVLNSHGQLFGEKLQNVDEVNITLICTIYLSNMVSPVIFGTSVRQNGKTVYRVDIKRCDKNLDTLKIYIF
jgi:hypothetical protein